MQTGPTTKTLPMTHRQSSLVTQSLSRVHSLSRAHRLPPQNTDASKSMHIFKAQRLTAQATDTPYHPPLLPKHTNSHHRTGTLPMAQRRPKEQRLSPQLTDFPSAPPTKPTAEILPRAHTAHITLTLTGAHRRISQHTDSRQGRGLIPWHKDTP